MSDLLAYVSWDFFQDLRAGATRPSCAVEWYEHLAEAVDFDRLAYDVALRYGCEPGVPSMCLAEQMADEACQTLSSDLVAAPARDGEAHRPEDLRPHVQYLQDLCEMSLFVGYHPEVVADAAAEIARPEGARLALRAVRCEMASEPRLSLSDAMRRVQEARGSMKGETLSLYDLGNVQDEESSQKNLRLSRTAQRLIDELGTWYGLRQAPLLEFLLREQARSAGLLPAKGMLPE